MLVTITSERVLLNSLCVNDDEFILQLLNSEGWLQYIGDRNIHSINDAIYYIKKIEAAQNIHYWVVRTKDTDVALGIISFLKRDYLEHFDIGFAFLPAYFGHGYAYEASLAVLSVLRNNHQHEKVLAITVPQNERSIKLLSKLGFHFEKEMEVEKGKLYIYANEL
jgi:[ribosomal protein S5]-alanine N-acetyltransferase